MSGYQAPTAELIAEALRRTPTPVLRRAFYGKLRNPLWVRPLMEAGAFTAPPEPQITDDGLIRDIYCPEVDYLARVAGEVPDDVVDVLVPLKDSNNAWVKRATAEIAAVIPAAQGVKLLPLLKAWATSSTGLGWRTDESSLVSFAVQLLDGGQVRPGRELANLLFMPRRPRSNEPFQRKPELTLDEHWYVTELPRIATALGGDALSATSGWLATYLKHAGYAGSDSDFSGIVRPSIRDRGDDLHQGPDDALVEVIRDLAVARLSDRDVDGVAAPLLRPKVQLHRKIAMYSVAEAIRSLVADSRDAAHLVPITRDLLSGDESDESNLRIEYAELAQAVAHVDRSALDVVNEFIASAYERDLEWMRARSVQPDAVGGAETDAEIVERADRYKHQMLSAIGAGALLPACATSLRDSTGGSAALTNPCLRTAWLRAGLVRTRTARVTRWRL